MPGALAAETRIAAPVRPFKRARITRPISHWEHVDTKARDDIKLTHWQKPADKPRSFEHFNVTVSAPAFDDELYEKHLNDTDWTKEDTQYLIDLFRECGGKWPVIVDHYDKSPRSMEDLKSRFYKVTAAVMAAATPISSMTKTDYELHEMLTKFNPKQEASRKRLAEGHLQRQQNEVDEEAVLLAELQRIMANQTSLDATREQLRERLAHPHANTNSYQYSTSNALTQLWQTLVAMDRSRRGGRFRPSLGGPQSAVPDSAGAGSAGGRHRDSNVGIQEQQTPISANPRLSEKEMLRFGVTHADQNEKFSSGITFASDKLSKPRLAKSNIQQEKIATVLSAIGVPELIPLPTQPVVDAFDKIITKLHTLLEMRKLAEKEEQELKVREAEAAKVAAV